MPDATLVGGDLKLAGRLDKRFFSLLEAIDATGSINRAARTAGYSYRGAWMVLEAASSLANEPLVERLTGGAGGGGSCLTDTARALMAAWTQLKAAHDDFLQQQEAWLLEQPLLAGVLRRLCVKTTARNQFAGRIVAVKTGPVTARITVAIRGGQEVVATMTSVAARRLGMVHGREAIALVKSSDVVLVLDFGGYALSAANQLSGTISRIDEGQVSSLIGLTLPGGAVVTASVANEDAASLTMAVGQAATAVFKAYAVILAVGPA